MKTQSKSLSQQRLLMSVGAAMECRIRNDRQSYFALARELAHAQFVLCLLYTSPSPRDVEESRMPSSA